jgi:hypothetical protein
VQCERSLKKIGNVNGATLGTPAFFVWEKTHFYMLLWALLFCIYLLTFWAQPTNYELSAGSEHILVFPHVQLGFLFFY